MRNNKREREIHRSQVYNSCELSSSIFDILSLPFFFLRNTRSETSCKKSKMSNRVDEDEIERNNARRFWELISRTFPCYCETFSSKKVVSGCIDSLPRRFLNRAGISFAPANLSNLLTEESGGSSLNRRTFVNCETTHARRRDKLVQFRHEILPFPALSKTKLNFLIIRTRESGGKIVIPSDESVLF